MQKHWDVMRTDDAGENWREVSGNLPSDFGFPIDVHAHEPETIYVVPIKSDSEHYPPEGKLRVYRSKTGGNEWEAADEGPAAERLLRERPARRDGGGLAGQVRHLLRHDGRAGLLLAGRRRLMDADRARSAGGVVGGGSDASVTRRRGDHSRKLKENIMPVQPVPPGYHTVTPYLAIKNALAALEFYKKAFGATERFKMLMPDGRLGAWRNPAR